MPVEQGGGGRDGRVALVTGGTRGIGLGIARELARDNWNLLVCGVRPEADVREVLDDLRRISGMDVDYLPADLASANDRARLVDVVRTRYGAVDALVNNAGRAPRVRADILDASEESFEELIRTNLQGPYFLTQRMAALMLARASAAAGSAATPASATSASATTADAVAGDSEAGDIGAPASRGAIVFVTSVSAEMASINRGDYCVSKAGLAMTVRLFAVRLAAHGIPVYEVRPGVIATDMTAGVREIYDRRIADGLIPEQRWGTPEDVGRTVAALLRGDVPYATGTVIHVDGGLAVSRL